MSNLTNETVQAWIEEEKRWPENSSSQRIVLLGSALLEARRDLADIANGLKGVTNNLDELKELL